MKIQKFNELPDDDAMVIVGSERPTKVEGEAQKECESCHVNIFVSPKNANRKHYSCIRCALTNHEGPVISTDRDLDEAYLATNHPGMDKEAFINRMRYLVQQEMEKYDTKKDHGS